MKRNKSFDNTGFVLYLVATPIGNLSEMSKRAIDTLNDVDLIAAEDTRNTYSLLEKFGIKKELLSLREHNESQASEHLISLIKEGKKVAYVSDAGYPGISDPGQILVKKALESGIKVSTISGSSAFLNALVASGLSTTHFYFYGFLPPKDKEAKEELENIKSRSETTILYESPHRIFKTLSLIKEVLNNRELVLARELTKLNEEYIHGTAEEILTLENEGLKGEMVIIISGCMYKPVVEDTKILNRVGYLIKMGLSNKNAIEITAEEMNISKNYIYKLANKADFSK
ncbi:MAG: 16S rRNA (cytidine(1402)-2'-O)-methyltransferase [Erysipelotrichaceae bacterium]|nr:16S rRNA (cytidine(1402)-2'-O)-methyltransferase [Erysipelotrichaceae bacterium]